MKTLVASLVVAVSVVALSVGCKSSCDCEKKCHGKQGQGMGQCHEGRGMMPSRPEMPRRMNGGMGQGMGRGMPMGEMPMNGRGMRGGMPMGGGRGQECQKEQK